jgi:hypothetical protein
VNFLECKGKEEAASQALMALKLWSSDSYYSQRFPRHMIGIHLVAYFGAQQAINAILGSQYTDPKDSHGQMPLSWAAENGHEAVVKLLQPNTQRFILIDSSPLITSRQDCPIYFVIWR